MTTPDAAVLFDIDGTLIDSTYHHALAWQRAFDRHDGSVPLWRIHRAVGMGGDKLVAFVDGQRTEERVGDVLREAWKKEYAALKGEVFALDGATDLIRKLKSQGYLVALASSGDPEFAAEAVATLNVKNDIDALTTADDAENSKPDPDLLHVTLQRLGVSRAVLVGDTPHDVVAANRAGIRCIAVRSGGYGDCELTDAGAVLVVDGPADLMDLDWEQYLTGV